MCRFCTFICRVHASRLGNRVERERDYFSDWEWKYSNTVDDYGIHDSGRRHNLRSRGLFSGKTTDFGHILHSRYCHGLSM